ncbi:hypothetical protein LX77_02999 [Gelidibacter algens]|uniref:Uncharacterized protein n=1 Tax=Gelidibacter algens TaxID=49280 RepID=A0A1A7QQ22_9FLAO|nr:hypothetical protein [Gelidibacter algens]OBX21314.1 hypothetical protein A9996_18250 [Gelidibacter algens]RAJ20741.1 hypothetical protein LX77_02999 [Gelidibacter algens]
MKYLAFLLLLLTFSCNHEKTVLLPEIVNADITEVLDVSPAYLFYDETKKDSIEMNRKNLIGTTNWLVNVDKRLTLGQVIPQIIFLQNKKRNAEVHKNENAKNYYTCNDTSIKSLGFIEFTDIIYKTGYVFPNVAPDYENPRENRIIVDFRNVQDIKLVTLSKDSILKKSTLKNLKQDLDNLPNDGVYEFILNINSKLTFQDYITFKSKLSQINSSKMSVNENEFIY